MKKKKRFLATILTLVLIVSQFSSVALATTAKNTQLTLNGVKDITIYVGEEFNPLEGITATDKEDGDITHQISLNDRLYEFLNTYDGFDVTNETISIDPENMTLQDKKAILAIRTANTSQNWCAAEIIYHAQQAISSATILQISNKHPNLGNGLSNIVQARIFKSAVKSDMGVGEENESGFTEHTYYDENGKLYKEQKEIFRDL